MRLNSSNVVTAPKNIQWAQSRRSFLTKSASSVAAILWIGSSFEALAQINNLPDAINKAGSLRMLSQRITKAWLQILGGITPDVSQKILNDSILLFDIRLSELQSYTTATKNVPVSIQYDVLENEWSEFRRLIRRNVPSAALIPTLIPKSDQVRNLANQAVNEFEKSTNVPANRIVNIAGRQRMLSQVVTRELILARIPGQPRGLTPTLIESAKLFRTTHQELLAHPGNTGAIKSQLEIAGMLWIFFENALLGKVPEISNQIASASENLLKTLDSLVLLYEKI